jgi:hypothetical protein
LNLSQRNPGVYASSLWKISMETASIFTATEALRPLHEHQLARVLLGAQELRERGHQCAAKVAPWLEHELR